MQRCLLRSLLVSHSPVVLVLPCLRRDLCVSITGLAEIELKEKFVRGSGPGGQSINKTRNKVQLTHLPTGIRVECQETRDLTQNRVIARKLMRGKIEEVTLGEDSKKAKRVKRLQRRKYNASRRAKAKYSKDGAAVEDEVTEEESVDRSSG